MGFVIIVALEKLLLRQIANLFEAPRIIRHKCPLAAHLSLKVVRVHRASRIHVADWIICLCGSSSPVWGGLNRATPCGAYVVMKCAMSSSLRSVIYETGDYHTIYSLLEQNHANNINKEYYYNQHIISPTDID